MGSYYIPLLILLFTAVFFLTSQITILFNAKCFNYSIQFSCSLVVKNQPLCQTFCQFGPILPHFCGNLIKKKQKNNTKNKKQNKKDSMFNVLQFAQLFYEIYSV